MDIDHLIELIKELPENSTLQYVRGNDTCFFESFDSEEPRIYAKTPAGKSVSFAGSYIRNMAALIEEYVPFNISQLMNNSGSNRPIIETVVAHTKEFFRYNKGNAIYVVWIPNSTHPIGSLENWTDNSVIKESTINVGATKRVSKVIIDLDENKKYSEDELAVILKNMYDAGEEDFTKTASLLLFSLKYGEHIGNVKALCERAGVPIPTAVSDGKKLYNLIKNQKYGMAFYSPNIEFNINKTSTSFSNSEKCLQQIFYGAPGTGKSYTINEITKKEKANTIRTTFHPDTDYASFVGAYKPTTKEVELRDLSGHKVIEGGKVLTEERISYEFVNQSFLKAYVKAWKLYAAANQVDEVEQQYLVIEEINRGNCAQIFGDLFQLLDRNASGFSDYPIEADADMQKQLRKQFDGLELPLKDDINALYGDEGRDIVGEVLEGKILLLPNNLYIWATMNTSDQSLFPIDSAFKRRWDWKYMPISDAGEGWTIELKHSRYDWWDFLEAINSLIGKTTFSEDKKLGYFFCKAKDGVISADMFVGKVIFYLWNDVFKDYGFEDEAFVDAEDEDENKLTFQKFYLVDGHRNATVNEEKVEMFLNNLGLEPIEEIDIKEEEDDNEEDDNDLAKPTRTFGESFSLNGVPLSLKDIAKQIVANYCAQHPSENAQSIRDLFVHACKGIGIAHVIETEQEFALRSAQKSAQRTVSEIVLSNGEKIYVSTQWRAGNPRDNFFRFREIVEANGWGKIDIIE